MNNDKQLIPRNDGRKEIDEILEKEKLLARNRGMKNQPYSTLNNFIQYAIGDHVQNFFDHDETGRPTLKNGIVRYGYGLNGKPLKSKDNAEIVILNAFSQEDIDKQMDEIIYKPIVKIKSIEENGIKKETNYSLLLKKVELCFVEELYNNFKGGEIYDNTITMKDTQLAKTFGVSRNYINQYMNGVLIALSQMQIRSYTPHKTFKSARRRGEEIPRTTTC